MLQFAYERRSAFASPASLAGFAGAMVCPFWRSDHGRDVPAGACAPGLTIDPFRFRGIDGRVVNGV
jgi:hypothetical protein